MSVVAVTGASGFVGSAVVRALVAQGRRVRALIEPGADVRNLEGLDVDQASCDVTDLAQVQQVLGGCESLFHLAAIYKLWAPDPEPLWRVNVEGTTNVLLAAQAAKIRRIVHTSSIMAVGLAKTGKTDETARFNTFDVAGVYTMTKYVSERIALRFAQAGAPIVVVEPSMPFGPGDRAPTPTGAILLTILEGTLPAVAEGTISLIDVDDCAHGHLLAEEKGRAGERYILNAHDVSFRDFVFEACRVAGKKPPRWKVPRPVGAAFALGMEKWSDWVSHETPAATLREALFTQRSTGFSSDKAARELGLTTRPLAETLERAITWFRENGMTA
jgi:dihydroflavonol-4-reductase